MLPPHVAHTGRAATTSGFRKRVLYLDTAVLDADLIGASVDHPTIDDHVLRTRIDQLHTCLDEPDALEAESRLALISDHVTRQLLARPAKELPSIRPQAAELRDLLDEHLSDGISLRDAAARLHSSPSQLVRGFSALYGLPPHRYLTGRRVLAARRRLLDGEPVADVATAVGFHDQAHLHRRFTRLVGTTPGHWARSAR